MQTITTCRSLGDTLSFASLCRGYLETTLTKGPEASGIALMCAVPKLVVWWSKRSHHIFNGPLPGRNLHKRHLYDGLGLPTRMERGHVRSLCMVSKSKGTNLFRMCGLARPRGQPPAGIESRWYGCCDALSPGMLDMLGAGPARSIACG